MGLLSKGTPLDWEKSKQFHAHVKVHGIEQFLNVFNQTVNQRNEEFKWGDEVEMMVVVLASNDAKERTCQLSLRGSECLQLLAHARQQVLEQVGEKGWNATFHPEYGCHMIEATPSRPYGGLTSDLRQVERNMVLRRQMVNLVLDSTKHEFLLTIPVFPLMGVKGVDTVPPGPVHGPVAASEYISDSIINPHPRFATLTRNIRTRRGSHVCINVPLLEDTHTAEDFSNPLNAPQIHADAMAFGMGSSCLQVTFQSRSLKEARDLYDPLAVLCPVFLALTAGSPFFRGRVAATDARWNIISASVDDRTPEERGEVPLTTLRTDADAVAADTAALEADGPLHPTLAPWDPKYKYQRIGKSRYGSIDSFIGSSKKLKDEYNDLPLVVDHNALRKLEAAGVDPLLARHVAHLYIRDPLVIFDEFVHIDDTKNSDHFENIQSTNWQTVRFKPPPLDNLAMGYRVEFRPMEVQLTDFENAAFTVFSAVMSRAILFFNLNLYMPITKVDENLQVAHKQNAVVAEKFLFRKVWFDCPKRNAATGASTSNGDDGGDDDTKTGVAHEYAPFTVAEIMCGLEGANDAHLPAEQQAFPGLIPMVQRYLHLIECDPVTHELLDRYMELIRARATGELMTLATWCRSYVHAHPDYKHDSVLSVAVAHDLCKVLHCVESGKVDAPQFLPDGFRGTASGQVVRRQIRVPRKATPGSSVADDEGNGFNTTPCCSESTADPSQPELVVYLADRQDEEEAEAKEGDSAAAAYLTTRRRPGHAASKSECVMVPESPVLAAMRAKGGLQEVQL